MARQPLPAPGAAERLDRLPVSRWLRTVLAVLFLGWLVESYDIGLIGSVLPSLSHVYHLSTGEKALVATASTIGIVCGILPAGRLADRIGRKPVLVVGTLLYAVLTAAAGLAPGIGVVIALRLLSGLAMGAVFPLPYVYGAELCPPAHRGRFTGIADSFLSIGYFASPLLAAFLVPDVADTTGWRVMFFLGGLPALFALVAWRVLPESPRWYETTGRYAECEVLLSSIERRVERETGRPLPPVASRRQAAPSSGPSSGRSSAPYWLRQLLSPSYLRRTLVLWVAFGGLFLVFYSIQIYLPTIVHSMGFTLTSSFAFTSVIVGVSIPGKLLEAWLVERWGRKRVIVGFGLVAALAALAFGLTRGTILVLAVGAVMSFFGIGVDPAVKVYTTESYPTALRGTATSATEGFGRFLSGIVGPALIPALLAAGGVTAAYGLVGGVALLAVVTVALLGEETRGETLEHIAEVDTARPVRVIATAA